MLFNICQTSSSAGDDSGLVMFLIFSGPSLSYDWRGKEWRPTSHPISLEINGLTAYLNVAVQNERSDLQIA
jgi:hypothetical protein